MKRIRNLVFICLLLYVSALSMKQSKAQSLLQTKMSYHNIVERASNFRMYGQFLEADCRTSTGQTKLCRFNINRRLKFNRHFKWWTDSGRSDCAIELGSGFLDKCKVTYVHPGNGEMETDCKFYYLTEEHCTPTFILGDIIGVDDDGNMTNIDFLKQCRRCWLDKHKYKCDCYDDKGKKKTSEINLEKKIRNKNGQLEYFFKGFQKSCKDLSLKSNIILSAECQDDNKIWRDTSLDLSNYFRMKNYKIKSYYNQFPFYL